MYEEKGKAVSLKPCTARFDLKHIFYGQVPKSRQMQFTMPALTGS